jgi:hypothetical protein
MNKQWVRYIFLFIFLAALAILIGHFHPDGLNDHCSLCELLAIGFTCIVPIILQPASYFIAKSPSIDPIIPLLSSYRQISLRAPPCHPCFPSLF